jgi:hypothetical protein
LIARLRPGFALRIRHRRLVILVPGSIDSVSRAVAVAGPMQGPLGIHAVHQIHRHTHRAAVCQFVVVEMVTHIFSLRVLLMQIETRR